jgi:hypothetical protein
MATAEIRSVFCQRASTTTWRQAGETAPAERQRSLARARAEPLADLVLAERREGFGALIKVRVGGCSTAQ